MDNRNRTPGHAETLRRMGIAPADADLLELMPLIEMVWADGLAADAELALLDSYIQDLTRRLEADQARVDVTHVEEFVLPFLKHRPQPEQLQTLRNIGLQRMLQKPDAAERRRRLLAACLDIGSAAVKQYPYPMGERFSSDEKKTFFEILQTIEDAQQTKLSTM